MFVNVYKVVCDLVHDCKSVCLSACLERIHVYLFFDSRCNARSVCVVVCNKSGGSGVDSLEHVFVCVSVGVPYSCTVLKCWSHKCVISYVFNVW